jgi:hypothetical protein
MYNEIEFERNNLLLVARQYSERTVAFSRQQRFLQPDTALRYTNILVQDSVSSQLPYT